MKLANENMIELVEPTNVFKHIETYLKNLENRSKNTANEYNRDIRFFFMTVKKKKIELLTSDNLKITLDEILNYQTFLKSRTHYSNNTINRMMSSIQSLYNFLKAIEYGVNVSVFTQVIKLPEDTEHIGTMSKREAEVLADLAEKTESNGLLKKALILFAASTSLRKKATTQIRFKHISPHPFKVGMYRVFASDVLDKGTQVDVEIHRELYEMIMAAQKSKAEDDLIFNFDASTITRMMQRLRTKAGMDDKRNLSFHSLKKTGVNLVHDATNSVLAAQKQGRHKNPGTTTKSYLEDIGNLAGSLMFEQIDSSIYEKLDRMELIYLLQNVQGGYALQLQKEAKKILERKKY